MARGSFNGLRYLLELAVLFVFAVVLILGPLMIGKYDRDSGSSSTKGPQVRVVIGEHAVCSGVYLGSGNILTAAHCVEAGDVFTVETRLATVSWVSTAYDVAMLHIYSDPGLREASLSCDPLKVGQHIYSATFPLGEDYIRSEGFVAGVPREIQQWAYLTPVGLSAAHGSSGGPVFNDDDKVVGIVVGVITDYGAVSFMVPSSAICAIVGRNQ